MKGQRSRSHGSFQVLALSVPWLPPRVGGDSIFMPPPLGVRGIMFSGCPSVRPKPEITFFHPYMGPLVHPTNRNRFAACLSVRLSGEVSRHLPENAWREWSEILHVDVSWAPLALIRLD